MNIEYTERPWGKGTLVRVAYGAFAFEAFSVGATIVNIEVPESLCAEKSICLGFDSPEAYYDPALVGYMGSTVGRVANRIRDAHFVLDDREVQLDTNWRTHHLHGGREGFSYQPWEHEPYRDSSGEVVGVRFFRNSPDGEGGYPGSLDAECIFFWRKLEVSKAATADEPQEAIFEMLHRIRPSEITPINTTNHIYWNLMGATNLESHRVWSPADQRLEFDEDLLPTGNVLPLGCYALSTEDGGAIDLASRAKVLEEAGGFDTFYILPEPASEEWERQAYFVAETDKLRASFYANVPGFQFYTAGALGALQGRKAYNNYAGFCVEPSGYVNAPADHRFPSVLCKAGECYERVMRTHFVSSMRIK